MSLLGNDFIKGIAPFKCLCSECRRVIKEGDECLVSIRRSKVMKRVCSEDCRLEFDARYWEEKARERTL